MFCRRSASLGLLLFVVMAIGLLGSVSPNLIRRLQQADADLPPPIAPEHTVSPTTSHTEVSTASSDGTKPSVVPNHNADVTASTEAKNSSRLVIIIVAVVVLLVIVAIIAIGLVNCGTDSVASTSAR